MDSRPTYQWADGCQSADLSAWVGHSVLPEAREHAAESLRSGWVLNWLVARGDHDEAKWLESLDGLAALQAAFATRAPSDPSDLNRLEQQVKFKELDVRRREADKALAQSGAAWWRRADPLLLAVIAAILTIAGNMLVAYFNSRASLAQEIQKAANELIARVRMRQQIMTFASGNGRGLGSSHSLRFNLSLRRMLSANQPKAAGTDHQ